MTGDKTDVDKFLGELREDAEKLKSLRFYDGIISTVMELNSNPAHFIWELLQNAEDAEATYITFILGQEALMVVHNGRDFTKEDVKSICNIGDSSKKAKDSNKIGKFGIGFKSVFNYTSTPSIHSGEFSFAIHEYFSPHPLNAQRKGDTLIVLPFDNPKKSKEKAFEEISIKLQAISSASLLFLKNIREIKVNIESGSEEIKEFCITREVLSSRSIPDNPNLVFEEIKMKDWQTERNYYRFTLNGIALQDKYDNGEAEIAENQSVMLAYPLSPSGEIRPISQTDDVKTFFVSFPTEVETHLEFLVHAPFKTVVSRETIKADSTANETLYDKIAELVGESLLCLVEENKVTRKFYNDILLNTEESVLHERIRGCLAGIINKQHKVLPTFSGEYASLDELLLFSEPYLKPEIRREVRSLFPASEIAQNIEEYGGKKYWDAEYYDSKLPTFLKKWCKYSEDSDSITFGYLISCLSDTWLEKKTVSEIIQLYTYLEKYFNTLREKTDYFRWRELEPELKEKWKALPLIRDPNGKHVPVNTVSYFNPEEIHQEICESEDAKRILNNLFSIREYNKRDYIRDTIFSKYQSNDITVSLAENLKDLKIILEAYNASKLSWSDIGGETIISAINAKTGEVEWRIPSRVYYTSKTNGPNAHAEELLSGVPGFAFLNPEYQQYFDDTGFDWDTFSKFGVVKELELFERVCFNYSYPSSSYKTHIEKEIRKSVHLNPTRQIRVFGVNGFHNVQLKETFNNLFNGNYFREKSYQLYKYFSDYEYLIRGDIKWRAERGEPKELIPLTVDSELGNYLKSKCWLVDKNGNLCSPESVTVDDLPEEYRRISESLLEKLGLSGAQQVNLQITGDDGEQKTVQISQKVYERTVQDIQEVEDNWKELLMADEPTGEDNPTVEERPTIGFALAQENRAEHIFDEDKYDASYISPVTNAERSSESIRSELSEKMQKYSPGNDDRRGCIADYGSYPTNTSSEIGLANTPIRIVSYDRNQLFICDSVKSNDKERRFLESQYKGVCQICGIRIKKGEPKSKDDFPYHYIARNVIRTKHLDEEIRMTEDVDAWNSLSLCPNCAAKYLFAEKDMSSFKEQVEKHEIEEGVSKFYDINIILEGRKERIRYKPKHFLALKTAFAYFAEKESEE